MVIIVNLYKIYGDKRMDILSIDYNEDKRYIEELREHLNKLIKIRGISSDEVIKVSGDLDKLIVKYYLKNYMLRVLPNSI